MTRFERLLTASDVICISCNHVLTMQELEEFNSSVDEQLQGIVYCHGCVERYLVVCRECSGRYTVEGICGECAAREYALAG
jgi:hypothetical protein